LQALLGPLQPGQTVRAVPGTGLKVPIWILGSSLFGAQLAGMLGLPYAFASHFAPAALIQALDVYRSTFQPGPQLDRPYAMVGVNVIAAETDTEARRLFTSVQQAFTGMVRGKRGLLKAPIDDIEAYWSSLEKAQVSTMLTHSYVGSPATVRRGLERLIEETGADELIAASAIFDHPARLRSYQLLAEVRDEIDRVSELEKQQTADKQ
jgi:luciferase family oxidoreductase group 1